MKTDFRTIEEAEDGCGWSGQKNESEASEQGEGRAKKQNAGSGAKKGRVDLKIKAKTKTWSVVVKGLEEDESTQPIQSRRVFQTSRITWRTDGLRGTKVAEARRRPTKTLGSKQANQVAEHQTRWVEEREIGGVKLPNARVVD